MVIKIKHMKKIFLILIIAVGLISCDDTQPVIFDGSQTLVYFPNNSANLDVVIDDTGSLEVQINTTTLSSEDRNVTLEIVEEDTTVDFDNIEIPNFTTTIPAGEYFASFPVNGIDNTVETSPELLTLQIVDAGDDATIDPSTVEIRVRQICPIPEGTFTGPYLLEQVTPIHPANGVPTFETQVVDVFENGGSTERAFSAVWIEGLDIGQAPSTIPMDLSCNNVLVTSDEIDTGLICDQEAPSAITLGSAETTGTYDATDDSSFSVIISEYLEDGGCGVAPPLVTEFNLTKQ